MESVKSKLSTMWIFATFNYLYCDVVTLMDRNVLKEFLGGRVGGVDVTQGFLLGAGMLVEIPMAMLLLSRLLGRRVDRLANVAAGALMTIVQAGTLAVHTPTPYYAFFSAIEIACTAAIVWFAWTRLAVGPVPAAGRVERATVLS